jgi:hypothetical protein
MGAPAQNPNDGTTLGTAEIISDEYIDPTEQAVRGEPLLPVTGYKLPRSKIAVGQYGIDMGDATADQPLHTESRLERQMAEIATIRQRDTYVMQMQHYSTEYVSLIDARGRHIDSRGVR